MRPSILRDSRCLAARARALPLRGRPIFDARSRDFTLRPRYVRCGARPAPLVAAPASALPSLRLSVRAAVLPARPLPASFRSSCSPSRPHVTPAPTPASSAARCAPKPASTSFRAGPAPGARCAAALADESGVGPRHQLINCVAKPRRRPRRRCDQLVSDGQHMPSGYTSRRTAAAVATISLTVIAGSRTASPSARTVLTEPTTRTPLPPNSTTERVRSLFATPCAETILWIAGAGVFRLIHDGGLAAPSRLSNVIGGFCPIAPCGTFFVVVPTPILHLFLGIRKA